METGVERTNQESLRALPGADVRQIMWRFGDRYDLQMLVQAARSVARGIVARLVAGFISDNRQGDCLSTGSPSTH